MKGFERPIVGPSMPTGNLSASRRRNIRLKGFDYSRPGAYFVTICTRNRVCEFGEVINGTMRYSEIGRLTQAAWEGLPRHYPHVKIDIRVLMPNPLHAILILAHALVHVPRVGAGLKPAPTSRNAPRHRLPEIVRTFKTFSARRINAFRDTVGRPFWLLKINGS